MIETKKPTVLIVDDDLSVRESFTLVLEEFYHIEMIASGPSALERIKQGDVDLVFLDVRMPGVDGLETLHKIKRLNPHLPVIMVTAAADLDFSKEAIATGAAKYIMKPFEVSEILKTAKEMLKGK